MAHHTKQIHPDDTRSKSSESLIQKLKQDKIVVSKFIRGEVSEKELNARGIRFVKPL
jgi:hypothetical protein